MNEIDRYIQDHRDRFTRAALDEKLRAAGHDDAAIEAAWARAAAGDNEAAAVPRTPAGILGRLILTGLVAVAYGYVGFIGLIGVAFTLSYNQTATGLVAALQTLLVGAYGLAMLASFVYVAWRIWSAGTLGRRGSTIPGAVGVAFVLLVGVSGACFALTWLASAFKSNL
jgi:hypothetical protein